MEEEQSRKQEEEGHIVEGKTGKGRVEGKKRKGI